MKKIWPYWTSRVNSKSNRMYPSCVPTFAQFNNQKWRKFQFRFNEKPSASERALAWLNMGNEEFIASQTAWQHNSAGKWNSHLYSYSIRWIPFLITSWSNRYYTKDKRKTRQKRKEKPHRGDVFYRLDFRIYVLRVRFCVWYSWMCEIINHYEYFSFVVLFVCHFTETFWMHGERCILVAMILRTGMN